MLASLPSSIGFFLIRSSEDKIEEQKIIIIVSSRRGKDDDFQLKLSMHNPTRLDNFIFYLQHEPPEKGRWKEARKSKQRRIYWRTENFYEKVKKLPVS